MQERFTYSREPRVAPSREVLAQVRVPGGARDWVTSLCDLSPSGALLDVGDLTPRWLAPGQKVELTLVAEGETDSIELRGPIARVAGDGPNKRFAVRLERPSRRARRYLQRLLDSGQLVRAPRRALG